MINTKRLFIFILLVLLSAGEILAKDFPLAFTDSSGKEIRLPGQPGRVVTLVPSISEIIAGLGAAESIVGLTRHDTGAAEFSEKELVGGFLAPDLERINDLEPDLIFYATLQKEVIERYAGKVNMVNLSASSIGESFDHIRLLGRIFGKEKQAEEIIAKQQRLLTLIEKKTASIPVGERLRTVRLMDRNKVLVPGDDSFQNEYIQKAGGIAPRFGKNGHIIRPDLKSWQQFNPQIIYGCGSNQGIPPALSLPGWEEVDAVKNNRIFFFPCDLTCRVSTHTGDFVSLLAARLYNKQFGDPANLTLPVGVVKNQDVELDYDYVVTAEKLYSDILDFRHKTLVIRLKEPMTVLSSLDGWRQNIKVLGNHYFPPVSWGLGHSQGLKGLKETTCSALGLREESTSMLFTGADMDNLAIATVQYKDMQVTALVTAGVRGNAVRMGKDTGSFYELNKADGSENKKKPGTINVILLTNTKLSKRAMTRALISAVEGKTAALQDLDIRSTVTPEIHSATGTGTDNILIVQGEGPSIEATGGHTKMGELIARAVHDGVVEAIAQQNGITIERSIFARLEDRKISDMLLSKVRSNGGDLRNRLEQLLLDPVYSDFIAASFAISDHYERGLINDLSSFDSWCRTIAAQIVGRGVEVQPVDAPKQPLVLRKAFGALVSGLQQKNND